jgi:hypothetical protein
MSARTPPDPPAMPWTFRQLARRRADVERCELCGRDIPAIHQHLIEPATRRLACACDACAILFGSGASAKYKRVPRDARALPDFNLSDAQWDSFRIPIDLAFFFESSRLDRVVALYPSPAGPTESLLRLETWKDLVRDNPPLRQMSADVEALLINRVGLTRGSSPAEYYILPIDECFKLVGLMRMHWKGLSGGTEVWRQIGAFFEEVRKRAIRPREASHA